ncbi:hypothetical protein BASA50_005821 [Batrachochytrium salamandrivorans]|uniref:DUF1771 domain-containing protein n=1 Tax=Batrachochytrium salamandrivorans TaxID=1357716 RepID=A0ABQ8FBL7_9FUNG|nr:hypothetical protein BASA50_005821 [Batrachochytrium salamandrivorans]
MKLISFAVISLLAITVSAYPGLGTPPQYTQHYDQLQVEDKLVELKAAYEKEMEIQKSFTIEDFVMAEQRVVSLRSKMRYFKLALKEDDISEAEQSARIEQYVDATKKWKKAYATMIAKNNEFKKARENRDNAHIELLIMKKHHERIAKHNVNNQDKMELSSCSYYNLEILKVQSDDVCRNAKDLAISKKGVTYDIYKLGRAIHKADESEKDKLVQTRKDLRSFFKDRLGGVELAQKHCSQIKNHVKDLTQQLLVINGEADMNQRWLDGTVEHESMGTRHDNRMLGSNG